MLVFLVCKGEPIGTDNENSAQSMVDGYPLDTRNSFTDVIALWHGVEKLLRRKDLEDK